MKKLSIEEMKAMKKIANEIISKELANYPNMKVYLFPVTNLEYYTSYVKQFIKFCIDNNFYININAFSYLIKIPFSGAIWGNSKIFDLQANSKANYIIFICICMNKIKKTRLPHVELLRVCYHEARHIIQQTFDDNSYSSFLINVEGILLNNDNDDYNKNHNNYSFEIGANLYSTFKTEEAIKNLKKVETNKNANIYKLEKDYIEDLGNTYKLDYMLYDAVGQMNKVFDIVNEKKLKINDEIPIFNIFMKDDNSFKSIEDMIKNPNFDVLDKRIVYTVLSSNSFLKSIEIEKLSDEELDTLNEALQYTYTVYNNQYQFIWKKFNNEEINFKLFIESAERLIKNIKEIDKHLLLLKSAKENKKPQFSKKY
ncbi:MAG: hypothetical protein HFI86_08220 [Bacilli bacterium]|nr:hypothetical protein [Bacilli bacterium]MCI9435235.1 hypothetical protein [Bacilli bacterium]